MNQVLAKKEPSIPGEAGIWLFIAGDVILFSLLFGLFMDYRADNPIIFASSQAQLDQSLGLINTLLMLSSSWMVASGVHAARMFKPRYAVILLLLAVLCGLSFMVVKYFEYSSKIQNGITLLSNDFFMFYYVYTGIHLIHVVLGTGGLIALVIYVRSRPIDEITIRNLESGASFWHLVDLLWIVLFTLLYLVH